MAKLMAQELPGNIVGDMNIALALVSFTTYSGRARHFNPPTQKALILLYGSSSEVGIIANAVKVAALCSVLEVWPMRGSLTSQLLAVVGTVYCVVAYVVSMVAVRG